MQEEWRPVVGYEGLYEVSNLGAVRGVSGVRLATQKDGSTYSFNYIGQELKSSVSFDGYHEVGLSYNGTNKIYKVHRLVMEAFCPNEWSSELEVNHRDGNKDNNCVNNLEMMTHQENMDHYWHDPVFKDHRIKYYAYAKDAMTERWKDPNFRNKVQSVFDSLKYKKAHSEAGKQVWSDPDRLARRSELSKEQWSDPEFHARQIEAIKQGWSNPEKRKAASERLQGLVWMHSPEGANKRVKQAQVDDFISAGYVLGRSFNDNIGGKIKVYCAKNGQTYSSMTECERDLRLKPGDVHHILKGPVLKRLLPVQADLQLSVIKEDE